MQSPLGGAIAAPPLKNDELVPNLNNYVRAKLSKSEVLTFADCARALAEALNSTDGSSRELIAKVLIRMSLFGSLPPSILPMLVSVRVKLDLPKTADRKLLRIVNYLIQLAAGEGSAGTVVPFSTLVGQSLPSRATDVFDYNALDPLWADVKSETVTHYQRAAAFRALAALARSSLSSDPDDLTLVSHLMAAVATTLDRCEASKRRKLPFGIGQGSKKVREMDRRQTLERVAAQRAALSASRAGLPGFVLSSKIAPRAAGGVNSPDAACARHALGVAALAARDMPAMYVEQTGQFVLNTLEIHRKTGSLGGAEQAAAIAAAAADGMPAPLRPTKELFQEKSLNLVDDWARLYLARGCGAVVHAGVGNSGPFWEMLVLLACCDRSIIVALEAIRALAGAPYPTSAAVASSPGGSTGTSTAAGGRRVLLPDEHVEADARLRYSMAWNLLMAHADDDAPASSVAAAAGAAAGPTGGFNRQFTISRTQRAVQESAALRRLASLGSDSASGSRAAAGATGASSTTSPRRSLFSAIVSRLLTCLGLMSHAAICSATRVVAILAEARAHALAATRTAADRGVVLGDEEVQHLMQQLEQRMVAIASDAGFSAHQREKALEALLWFSRLPPGRDASPLLTSKQVAHWISSGGGTVSPAVRAIFADPWPEDVVASFMLALSRRLLSAPAAANFLLSCAAAAASAAPSRVRQEQLHAMWDVCLRANAPAVKLAGLQAALSLMCAPTPAIAAPPSAAAPEVKALASKEEAAMVSLSRSAAWWVGENANFGTGEYAWQQRNLTDELVKQLESADTASQQQLAAAAVAINPVLAMLIARLQRVMVTGLWEVRIAAAQALAKIAVRSGEPFRIQCYSILAIAAAGSIAHRSRSSSRGGPAAAAAAAAAGSGNNGAAAAAAASAAMQGAAADPLGVAAVAGPALEVLDHIYAGELVVEQLLVRYGLRRSKWPKKLLKTMEKRNAALVAAISERVCYVPKEHFWPLGNAAKEVITGKEEDEEEVKQRKKKEKEEKEAAKKAAAEVNGETQPLATAATAEQPRRRYDSSDEESPRAAEREANMLDKLQGYDYDPSAPHEDLEYPDDSVSQIDHTDDEHYRDAGAASDDDSDIVLLRGMALYDFTPEEEDEVGISKGETVDVEYEVGGWLQVIRADGGRGLVPKSYVLIKEEEEDSDALSLAGRSSTAGQQTQAQGAADYNSFLERSSMRLRPRISTADSETSSTAPYGSLRQRQQSARRRQSVDEGEGEEPVEALMMSRMVAQVAQQGGEVDRTLEQVDDLERVTRSGGTFNQPQYLHLKEALNAVINSLDQLKLSGDARNMRRQMVDRAIIGLDKLESMHRYVMAGGSTAGAAGGGSPMSTPRQPTAAQSLGAELPPISDAEGATAEEDYQYVPTKVRAVFAFDAEAEGELSMAVGDSLWVEAEVDGWYQVVRDGDGARGLVPTSYVDVEQF